jgi:sarcosine oxidase
VTRTEFAVVGAGLLGLSAAWALTRRGYEVTVIDQAPIGDSGSGSFGACRIFRLGYEHSSYVTLAIRARDNWTELEEISGERLLFPTPQLTFGPHMHQVRAALEEAGAPGELLCAEASAERFPGFAAEGDVLHEPGSAVILAGRSLEVLAGLIGFSGDPVAVTALADRGDRVVVRTTQGEIEADRLIVCAGPWTPKLVATAGIAIPGSASMEQVAYLTPASALTPAMPIFVHYGGEFPYGLPVPGSEQYKIGIHFGGPPVDPQRQDHGVHAGLSAQIERAARRFLPGFDPNPVAVERCIYDNSPDTDFIIDRVGNIVIGSGTSGHGFKFGPLIGEWLAGLATSKDGQVAGTGAAPPWLALNRFAAPATVLLWVTRCGLSTANMTEPCTGT